MNKWSWVVLSSALVLTGCNETATEDEGVAAVEYHAEDEYEEFGEYDDDSDYDFSDEWFDEDDEWFEDDEWYDEDDDGETFYQGTAEFDEEYYYVGHKTDPDRYKGEDLESLVGVYSVVTTRPDGGTETKQQTVGEIREDGTFTFYHFNVIQGDSDINDRHVRAGYYLDANMDVQRRDGWLIPWTDPVRVQTGQVVEAYGEKRLSVEDDFRFEPSLNPEGKYEFVSLRNTDTNLRVQGGSEFLGDALDLVDDELYLRDDLILPRAELDDFTDIFALDNIRSAYLVDDDLRAERYERRLLVEDSDRMIGSYLYGPYELKIDFRLTNVVKDTEEYNRYMRDNTLVEMDYVFEVKTDSGALVGIYGYKDHFVFELDTDDDSWAQTSQD